MRVESHSELIESAGVEYKVYCALSGDMRQFIDRCIGFGITNSAKTNFSVGDVVIKKLHGSVVTDHYGIIRRWTVVAQPFGLLVGRMVTGKKELGNIDVLNYPGRIAYSIELDPNYVSSLLLQNEYNPDDEIKASIKKRRAAAKYNRSISVFIDGLKTALEFLAELKPGDTIWTARSALDLSINPTFDSCTVEGYLLPPPGVEEQMPVLVLTDERLVEYRVRHGLIGTYATTKQPYPISKIVSP